MSINKGYLILAAVAVAAVGYYAYLSSTSETLPADIASGNGRIEAVQVDISSKIPGRVSAVNVREGDLVDAGQVVALIDDRSLKAQLARALAEKSSAESQIVANSANVKGAEARQLLADRELARTQQLVERGVTSEEALEVRSSEQAMAAANLALAKANLTASQRVVDAAEAAVDEVKAALEDATLSAPTYGRVLYRLAEPGEIVGAGGRILSMVDLSEVYLEFFIPAHQAHRIAIGSEARIKLDITEFALPAKVTFVSPVSQFTPRQVETESERLDLMFRVRVRVPQDLVKQNIDRVMTGLRGVAYVRLQSDDGSPPTPWPDDINTLPPQIQSE